ncbi:sensor domain-containing diguanylate cyclase [Tsuneonella mangrovi]|uniref:GGDEF domain-containing protein n=1 Tax=Tsuneonella mangrovi TaxID=1982042 RepID=UPI000BA2B3DA|nr:diguanylate cyclase [Tsuneonella mangrovi]
MGRLGSIFAAFALVLGIALSFSAPAAANELYDRSCLLTTPNSISYDQARASAAWDCKPGFNAARTGHSWQQVSLDGIPPGKIAFETAGGPIEQMRIVMFDKRGLLTKIALDGHELARDWMPGNSIAIPLPVEGKDLASLYVAIDGEPNALPVTEISLRPEALVQSTKVSHSVLYAMAFAVLLTVGLFSAFMAVAVGTRTTAYHAIFSCLAALYTASSSSLIFLLLPGLTMWERTAISYASLGFAVPMLGPIVMTYFEQEIFSKAERRAMWIATGVAALGAFALPASRIVEFDAKLVYHLLFIPGVIVLLFALIAAWRRGSRVIGGFLVAWSLPLVAGIERILRGAGLYYLPSSADAFLFIGLAAQAFLMAAAIATQADAVRRERDDAHDRAREMQGEALSDPLTGLYNRRDFDARQWRRSDILAIIDIDRFKRVNDTFGHDVGDEVLKAIARVLKGSIDSGRILRAWRLGGEEFAVAMTGLSTTDAAVSLNELRTRISAEIRTAAPQINYAVTASAGLAGVGEDGMRQAYRAADAALYRAKASGRDRLSYEIEEQEFATIFPRRRNPGTDAAAQAA